MDASDLIDICLGKIRDTGGERYTQPSMLLALWEALDQLSQDTEMLREENYVIPLEENKNVYDLPANFLNIINLGYGKNNVPMTPKSQVQRDVMGFDRRRTGPPRNYWSDKLDIGKLGIWPTPTDSEIPWSITGITIGAVNGAPDSFTDSGGNIDTSEVTATDTITASGFTAPADNASFAVGTTITASEVEIEDTGTLTTEAAGNSVTLSKNLVTPTDGDGAVFDIIPTTDLSGHLILDYVRAVTLPSPLTTYAAGVYVNDATLDTDIPDFYYNKLYLLVCGIRLLDSRSSKDRELGATYLGRYRSELLSEIKSKRNKNSGPGYFTVR